jgi:hypothetical protein
MRCLKTFSIICFRSRERKWNFWEEEKRAKLCGRWGILLAGYTNGAYLVYWIHNIIIAPLHLMQLNEDFCRLFQNKPDISPTSVLVLTTFCSSYWTRPNSAIDWLWQTHLFIYMFDFHTLGKHPTPKYLPTLCKACYRVFLLPSRWSSMLTDDLCIWCACIYSFCVCVLFGHQKSRCDVNSDLLYHYIQA